MALTSPAATHLHFAIEQCIDSLCFAGTHFIDAEFRSQSTESAGTIAQLQAEQRTRITANFGPAKATADMIAAQLEELYTADALAIANHNREADGQNVVEAMTDETAKIFKKEMKQRIHDWESAFRSAKNREPGTQDKAQLRLIYELYRTVKNRVNGLSLPPPAAVVKPPIIATQPQPEAASVPKPRHVDAQPPQQQQQPMTGSATPQYTPTAPQQRTHKAPSQNVSTASSVSAPTLAAPHAASSSNSLDELKAEKKQLKQKLHKFEDEFKDQHGRIPTKEDRAPHFRDYQRYGELKKMLSSVADD